MYTKVIYIYTHIHTYVYIYISLLYEYGLIYMQHM